LTKLFVSALVAASDESAVAKRVHEVAPHPVPRMYVKPPYVMKPVRPKLFNMPPFIFQVTSVEPVNTISILDS
jgi:hypothetical protein